MKMEVTGEITQEAYGRSQQNPEHYLLEKLFWNITTTPKGEQIYPLVITRQEKEIEIIDKPGKRVTLTALLNEGETCP